jgi:inhibitor of KinA sporulation pathway (predicted exonuclease)
MRYIVVDLEATCWEQGQTPDRMEIIEIGAVSLPSASLASDTEFHSDTEFQSFVRPVAEPQLSPFCRKLTTIEQASVDTADIFPIVLDRFLQWIGPSPITLCSWGAYDLEQFRIDCRRHKIEFPKTFQKHINLKAEYRRFFGNKHCGMATALQQQKIPFLGTHHRGIDDARNIAQLAHRILPKWEQQTGT